MAMSGGRIRTFFDGAWHEGNPPIVGAADHGIWQGTTVFDGARMFEGAAPDLDLHCARVNRSAALLGLKPLLADGALVEIAQDGLAAFDSGAEVYIRPMYWSTGADASLISADPETTVFSMCLEELPMPGEAKVEAGMSAGLTQFRRPLQSMMPTEAKAACLYPNNARMAREARGRGFDTALALDGLGNVAEFASSNIFIVKDGVAATPIINGTFLNGITRQRVIALLRANGVEVREAVLTLRDVEEADEIFSTGNATKVMAVTRYEDRTLPHGPIARLARRLYWDYALG